ncbi:hypothetical protein TNCV_576861 [Trichonephila clavipes]|nr:hypothetical protein TNCV_576861 [Trichonephila clavipes]
MGFKAAANDRRSILASSQDEFREPRSDTFDQCGRNYCKFDLFGGQASRAPAHGTAWPIGSYATVVQQPMRAKAYCAHLSIRDHWALRCMSTCPDQVVSLKRNPQCFSTQASLVLIHRPIEGMKGCVDLAQPELEPRTCGVEARYATTRPVGLC